MTLSSLCVSMSFFNLSTNPLHELTIFDNMGMMFFYLSIGEYNPYEKREYIVSNDRIHYQGTIR